MPRVAPRACADLGLRSHACPRSRSFPWPIRQKGSAMTRWSPRATRRLSPMCPSIVPRRSMSWGRGRRARRKRAAGGSLRRRRPTRGDWPRSSKAQCLAPPPCSTLPGAIGSRRSRRPLQIWERSSWPKSMRPKRGKAGAPGDPRARSLRFRAALFAPVGRARRGTRQRGRRGRAFPHHDARLPVRRCRRAAARVGRWARPRRGPTGRADPACDFEASRSGILIARPLPYIGPAQVEGRTSNG